MESNFVMKIHPVYQNTRVQDLKTCDVGSNMIILIARTRVVF